MGRPRVRHLRGRLLVSAGKAVAACALVTAATTAAAGTPQGPAHDPAPGGTDCSFRGAAAASDVPPTALIRTEDGRVRQVPFAVGWDVYTGRRPGELIAVCSDGSAAVPTLP